MKFVVLSACLLVGLAIKADGRSQIGLQNCQTTYENAVASQSNPDFCQLASDWEACIQPYAAECSNANSWSVANALIAEAKMACAK